MQPYDRCQWNLACWRKLALQNVKIMEFLKIQDITDGRHIGKSALSKLSNGLTGLRKIIWNSNAADAF